MLIPVDELEQHIGKQVKATSVSTSFYPEGFEVHGELQLDETDWVLYVVHTDEENNLRRTEIKIDTVEFLPEKVETPFVPTVFTEQEEKFLAHLTQIQIAYAKLSPFSFPTYMQWVVGEMFEGSNENYITFINKINEIAKEN